MVVIFHRRFQNNHVKAKMKYFNYLQIRLCHIVQQLFLMLHSLLFGFFLVGLDSRMNLVTSLSFVSFYLFVILSFVSHHIKIFFQLVFDFHFFLSSIFSFFSSLILVLKVTGTSSLVLYMLGFVSVIIKTRIIGTMHSLQRHSYLSTSSALNFSYTTKVIHCI